jgi:shikimate kinase
MKNLVLIGMPGCGKSTIGLQLAKNLDIPFYDMDDVIVQMTGSTIPELFEHGEDYFRDKETEAARLLSQKEGVVISCGGGVIKRRENITLLGATGLIFFINRTPEAIMGEIDISGRPLLADGKQKVQQLFKERFKFYAQYADYILDVEEPFSQTVPKIVSFITEKKSVTRRRRPRKKSVTK